MRAPPQNGLLMPFIRLTEVTVLAAIRKCGVPMSRIRRVLDDLAQELGSQFATLRTKVC